MLPHVMKTALVAVMSSLIAGTCFAGTHVTWINSTSGQPWNTMPAPTLEPGKPDVPAQVQVEPGTTYQTIDGFGGCFNELGWVALGKASAPDRQQVLSALFGDD